MVLSMRPQFRHCLGQFGRSIIDSERLHDRSGLARRDASTIHGSTGIVRQLRFLFGREIHFHAFKLRENRGRGKVRARSRAFSKLTLYDTAGSAKTALP
jgi:hypothetical protein